VKLKEQITEFEGTPEEFERADLSDLFESRRTQDGIANGGDVTNTTGAFPAHVTDFLDNGVPSGDARAVVEEVLGTAFAWGGINVKPAGGQSAGNYLRLYRRGSPFGAFMYMFPTYGQLRLTGDAAEGMKHAQARNVQSSNPHQVVVPLDDRAALDEVMALVRTAYDQAVS
jgi:hypothetical protein